MFASYHPTTHTESFLGPSVPETVDGFLEGLLTPFTVFSRDKREKRRLKEIEKQRVIDPTNTIDKRVTPLPEHIGQLCDVSNKVCYARDLGTSTSLCGVMATMIVVGYHKSEVELTFLVGALIGSNLIDYAVQQYKRRTR